MNQIWPITKDSCEQLFNFVWHNPFIISLWFVSNVGFSLFFAIWAKILALSPDKIFTVDIAIAFFIIICNQWLNLFNLDTTNNPSLDKFKKVYHVITFVLIFVSMFIIVKCISLFYQGIYLSSSLLAFIGYVLQEKCNERKNITKEMQVQRNQLNNTDLSNLNVGGVQA